MINGNSNIKLEIPYSAIYIVLYVQKVKIKSQYHFKKNMY